jgi:hypothetical protein
LLFSANIDQTFILYNFGIISLHHSVENLRFQKRYSVVKLNFQSGEEKKKETFSAKFHFLAEGEEREQQQILFEGLFSLFLEPYSHLSSKGWKKMSKAVRKEGKFQSISCSQ